MLQQLLLTHFENAIYGCDFPRLLRSRVGTETLSLYSVACRIKTLLLVWQHPHIAHDESTRRAIDDLHAEIDSLTTAADNDDEDDDRDISDNALTLQRVTRIVQRNNVPPTYVLKTNLVPLDPRGDAPNDVNVDKSDPATHTFALRRGPYPRLYPKNTKKRSSRPTQQVPVVLATPITYPIVPVHIDRRRVLRIVRAQLRKVYPSKRAFTTASARPIADVIADVGARRYASLANTLQALECNNAGNVIPYIAKSIHVVSPCATTCDAMSVEGFVKAFAFLRDKKTFSKFATPVALIELPICPAHIRTVVSTFPFHNNGAFTISDDDKLSYVKHKDGDDDGGNADIDTTRRSVIDVVLRAVRFDGDWNAYIAHIRLVHLTPRELVHVWKVYTSGTNLRAATVAASLVRVHCGVALHDHLMYVITAALHTPPVDAGGDRFADTVNATAAFVSAPCVSRVPPAAAFVAASEATATIADVIATVPTVYARYATVGARAAAVLAYVCNATRSVHPVYIFRALAAPPPASTPEHASLATFALLCLVYKNVTSLDLVNVLMKNLRLDALIQTATPPPTIAWVKRNNENDDDHGNAGAGATDTPRVFPSNAIVASAVSLIADSTWRNAYIPHLLDYSRRVPFSQELARALR